MCVTIFGTLPGLFIGIGVSLLLLAYRALSVHDELRARESAASLAAHAA
jgi:hypothetical protein